MSRFHRFQGLYWRQMFITVGMVLLTLMLLGASFGSLSYNYARSQKSGEIRTKAVVMSQLSVNYLESGRFLTIEELQNDRDFRQLASFAATVSDVHFMICDREGHVLLSTDKDLTGMTVTMPAKMTREIMEQGETSARDDLGGLYENKRFVVGVPAVNPTSGEVVGEVFAVSTSASLDAMWQGFVGLFFMTALVVLMISFMASSVTTMRQIQPIREMAAATRQYAEGNFDIRRLDVACHLIDVTDVFEADGFGLELGELCRCGRIGGLLEHAHGLKVVLGNVEPQSIAAGTRELVGAGGRKQHTGLGALGGSDIFKDVIAASGVRVDHVAVRIPAALDGSAHLVLAGPAAAKDALNLCQQVGGNLIVTSLCQLLHKAGNKLAVAIGQEVALSYGS